MNPPLNRRRFLSSSAKGLAAAGSVAAAPLALAKESQPKIPLGKAEHCIFIWLAGGACQIDTWDPKRKSTGRKDPGSYYHAIDTAAPGVQLCEHFQQTAPLMDRGAILRTVHHEVIDEHAAATNRVHTGRATSGTIVYPSIGSIVSHELGDGGDGVPRYVVMGYPNASRGPGFLGTKHSYIYLTETKAGPTGLKRPLDVTADRQRRRDSLLAKLRQNYLKRNQGDKRVESYAEVARQAFKLTGPQFMNVFQLDREPSTLRQAYGEEFGQRLLLSRRLIQSGVRFIEVTSNLNFKNGTGWDTHNQGQLKQHELIRELDRGLSTLIVDLEKHRKLDKTLIVIATEFGRPPEFDGGGGRGHQSRAFSVALFGGGIRGGQAVGQTDELGKRIVHRPISIPDMHATVHNALGIDAHTELYTDDDRPVPITDQGTPVRELFG